MPRYVSSGIWKHVALRVTPPSCGAIDDVVPVITATTTLGSVLRDGNNSFDVEVIVFFTASGPFSGHITVNGDWSSQDDKRDDTTSTVPINVSSRGRYNTTLKISAKNIALWWPTGVNPDAPDALPTLNNITVCLYAGGTPGQGEPDDTRSVPIGFRTFEFVGSVGNSTRSVGNTNASLYFRVNGHAIFAKGHNWMPSYVLPADSTADRADKAARLADARRVHANMIRVWGGGLYESDAFYDAADRLGLLILQDGSFFGLNYPTFPEFFANVRDEVRDNMRRLARHPSLVVVSGNNEASVFPNIPLYIGAELSTVVKVRNV